MPNIHHMTRKYGGLSGSFSAQLQQFADETMDSADSIFRDVVMMVGETLVRLSPVDEGTFRGAWRFSIGAQDDTVYETPDKDGSETVARMLAGVGDLTFGQVANIQNSTIYGIPLEFGHSQQAPNGFLRITITRFQEMVNQAVRNSQK